MTVVTVNDPIIAPSRGTLAQAIDYAAKANAVDAPAYLTPLWAYCQTAGIDALIPTAQWCVETDIGRSTRWRLSRNPAGLLIVRPGDPDPGAWTSAQAAAVHVVALMVAVDHPKFYTTINLDSVPGANAFINRWIVKYMAAQCPNVVTIADLCAHYVDAKGEPQATWAWDTTYSAQIVEHARQILAMPISAPAPGAGGGDVVTTFPSYSVAGLSKPIVLPVPLIQSIIPVGQTNQRPGIKRQTPGFAVVHETANTAAGADATMHARYLANGADGSQVSWHFTVDDHQIIQHIPIDEVTWQAADGSGPGNMSGVSCELCVNVDGNKALTRRNAEALVGTLCAELGLTVAQIKRHYDFNQADPNRHHCPDQMMNEGYWPQFVANAGVVIAANSPGASNVPPSKPTPPPTPKPPVYAKPSAVPPAQTFKTIVPVTPRQSAAPKAKATGPEIPAGTPVEIARVIFSQTTKSLWFVANDGSRLPVGAFIKAA